MRPILRLTVFLVALFLAIAPGTTFAQSSTSAGSTTTTTTTGPATSSDKTAAGSDSTTTTSTTTTNVPWIWVVVGAVVVVGVIGVVAAGNRGDGATREQR